MTTRFFNKKINKDTNRNIIPMQRYTNVTGNSMRETIAKYTTSPMTNFKVVDG